MVSRLRAVARAVLPVKMQHAYRVLRHTVLFPCERELVHMRRFLDPEKVAVDVGANVGLYTSVLARRAKRVIAFEPHPDCADYLRRLAIRNSEVREAAVSDRSGTRRLRVPLDGQTSLHALGTIETGNDFRSEARASSVREVAVETVTLDDALCGTTPCDDGIGFIKVDVEGHELGVLKGAERVVDRHRPVFLIEVEFRHTPAVGETFSYLESHGYVARAVLDDGLVPIDAERLRRLQSEDRLARKLKDPAYFGYVNNVFFIPAEKEDKGTTSV